MAEAGEWEDEPQRDVPEEEELSRVLREIADALGARGAMLTLHPETDGHALLVELEDPELSTSDLNALMASRSLDHDRLLHDMHVWHDEQELPDTQWMLSVPVQRVSGHPRLVLTAFFQHASTAVQAAAEAAYVRRRPFAVGYFRLWQRERLEAVVNASLRDALDLLDLGVLLIGDDAKLLHANIAARDVLDRADGLRLYKGLLQPTSPGSMARFHALLEHVLAPAHGREPTLPLLSLPRSNGAPLILGVRRAPRGQTSGDGASAILLLVDPNVDVESALVPMCRLFDLTPTETRLVVLLGKGLSTAEAAALLHVSEASVRSYLKQVFAKTGARRQAELLRLLLMSAVRVRPIGAPPF